MKLFNLKQLALVFILSANLLACKKEKVKPSEEISASTEQENGGPFTNEDFIKASGTVLRNKSGAGDIINLRGTNLGSWLSMEGWIGPLHTGALNRSLWTATASGSPSGVSTAAALDNDLSTRWHNGSLQGTVANEWFKIDLGKIEYFDQITFDAGDFINDFPNSFRIEISLDNTNWTSVGSGTGSKWISIHPGAVEARYVRIFQTSSSSTNEWSIAEFNLYMDDDFSVRNRLIERFGLEKADELWDSYQDVWIQESDLDRIKSWGMNMVRVPIFWRELMDDNGTMKSGAFKQLDWIVTECTERRIYVILDLHGAPGGVDGYITSGQALKNELWTSPAYQQMTIDIWKAIAAHYKGNPTVAAYDLLNEPVSNGQPGALSTKAFYNVLYQAVRPIDSDHLISMGAFYGFDFLGSPASNGWANVIYQAHYYNTDFENAGAQVGFANWAAGDLDSHRKSWNVPVYAGEFNFWKHPGAWRTFLSSLNANNISWSNWTYKNLTTTYNWGYYQGNPNPIPDINTDSYETIKQKWSKFGTINFTENTALIDLIREYTRAKPFPL